MAAEYFLYHTGYNNTLMERSNTSFAPFPPDTGEIYIDYFIPNIQTLYLYRESGGTIIYNDQETIENFVHDIVSPPTPHDYLYLEIFTGYTGITAPTTFVNVSGDTMTGSLTTMSNFHASGQVSGSSVYGSVWIHSPIISGSSCVQAPITCGKICVISPITCGTTRVESPVVCGSTCVRSPITIGDSCVCSPIILGSTSICSPTICSSTCLCSVGTTRLEGGVTAASTLNVSGNTTFKQIAKFLNYNGTGSTATGNLWWQSPRLYFNDGLAMRDVLQGSLQGSTFPANPKDGDLFYRTSGATGNNGLLYVYDQSRGKYLSTTRTNITFTRDYAAKGVSAYYGIGSTLTTANHGIIMARNGTITSFTYDNNVTVTAPMNIQIRMNNAVAFTGTIPIGGKSFVYKSVNVNFNEGDRMQVYKVANAADGIEYAFVQVEVAWRA